MQSNNNILMELSKSVCSENVIRKALYWQSPISEWVLDQDEKNWIIKLITDDFDGAKSHFDKLINDQLLREQLDIQTGHFRRAIIKRVLSAMEDV